MTIKTLLRHRRKLATKFGSYATLAYPDVSYSQLSVFRYYGGGTINGHRYTYFPEDDILVRDDVVAFLKPKRRRKTCKKSPASTSSPSLTASS